MLDIGMLRLLSVTNFATIEQLEIELAADFNVLTGETGAGKSIIVDAVSLLLGGRADAGMVRSGARQARVEGVFLLGEDLRQAVGGGLDEYGIESGDEDLIVAREVNLDGRNTCRVNGRIVPLRLLSGLAERLVDIHGQNEHLSLLRVREHMDILDKYGGLGELRSEVGERVRELIEVRRELEEMGRAEREFAQRVDFLRYQVEEINSASLRPGEDEELIVERDRVANAERIISLSDHAYRALYEGFEQQQSAADLMGQAARDLGQLERLDPSLRANVESAEGLNSQIEDLARTLRGYRDGIVYSPERLVELEERLEVIRALKRKYGGTIEEVLAFGEKAASELEKLYHSEERKDELEGRESELRKEVGEVAGRLSGARRDAGERLAEAIREEAAGLAMEHAQVVVDISQSQAEDGVPVSQNGEGTKMLAFSGTGVDSVEFLISLNPGEPPRPLARVASGGEASRLMLAIKTILSTADQIPILVFDEVDAGIGGRVGGVVGQKLWGLSKNHQVLCVTHLPQIACYADNHVRVVKTVSRERTMTSIETLDEEGRVTEVSQMLGSGGGAARVNAVEMLEEAGRWKESR